MVYLISNLYFNDDKSYYYAINLIFNLKSVIRLYFDLILFRDKKRINSRKTGKNPAGNKKTPAQFRV